MTFALANSFVLPLSLPRRARELEMLWVEAGSFLMGSPAHEAGRDRHDECQFHAVISHGYWLGKTQITQSQWMAIMGGNPSRFQQDGMNRPVENVNWHDAQAFCKELDDRFSQELPEGYRFALPTEAQWEYACRAGTQTKYHCGNSEDDLDRVAWHSGNSGGQTHPVAEKQPNPWGFYDMHGNVGEWCHDWAGDYPTGEAKGWEGPDKGLVRIVRPGTWGTPLETGDFRCACRTCVEPDVKREWIGFRLSLRRMDIA